MRNIILTLLVLIMPVTSFAGVSAPIHTHLEKAISEEFFNVYYKINNQTKNPSYDSIVIKAGGKLFFDGVNGVGDDTYISQTGANIAQMFTGGTQAMRWDNGNVQVGATRNLIVASGLKLFLDGGFNTYLYESSSDNVLLSVGGSNYAWDTSQYYPGGDGTFNLGASTSLDWNIVYYHTLSQHSTRRDKQDITSVDEQTIRATRLPSPKRYRRNTSTGTVEYGLIAEDCPEEVIFREEGEIAGINTNALISYMCGVIKKLESRIVELEKK